MTDPIKAAMKAATEANRQQVLKMTRPALDAFNQSSVMQDMKASFAVTNFLDNSPLVQAAMYKDDRISEALRIQMEPTTRAIAEAAAIRVEPFQRGVIDAMPEITAMWKDRVDTPAFNQALAGSPNFELPQIDFGLKEAFQFNAFVPEFETHLTDAVREMFGSQESLVSFQTDMSAITRAISTNSGVGTIGADILHNIYSPGLAEAMRALAPQLTEFPDFAFFRDYADAFVDEALASTVEEQIASDADSASYLDTAIYETTIHFGVSRDVARKMVLGTVWTAWVITIMSVLLLAPPPFNVGLGAFMSASSKLTADNIALFIANLIMPNRDD
ncbi:hypothetical protein BJD99_00325 [Rhodococcus sp. 1163]|uniref:hypothetical protein n=1 Tax=Rhodococcus sp. 1163 TaxID=1905289 RepID=UPI0009FCA560|nr:hypothetical protein [Rhodococcus sp. 1163]ORI20005.1 hypothetical protein BJD99_00325 [Rhodococcus sp. 1163]